MIQIDLKSHGKGRNKKNFSILCISLTSMQNCKSQIQWIGQILFVPHQYIYIYKSRDLIWESMRFCQVVYCITSFSFRLSPHLNLAFMSNYYVMANAFIQMYLPLHNSLNAFIQIYLRSLRNLNYTKFNKETIWIYQCHKKKNKHANTWNITIYFLLTKRIKKKKTNKR